MYKISYTVEFENSPAIRGTEFINGGEWCLSLKLPDDIIKSAKADMELSLSPDEKIFMNGFQTWTSCPEYTAKDKIKGLDRLPKAAVKYFGLERYGDYYFKPYPQREGVLHGESWCYFRRGDKFRLIASLDERAGYTLFQYDAHVNILSIERDCAGIRANGVYPVFQLYFAQGSEDDVFDGWFKAMNITPRTEEKLSGYSSWYNRYQNIDEKTIGEDLEGCAGLMKAGDLFQIDDGWEPTVGDWLETDAKKFPRGLKPLADEIHNKGYKAGLWLAPFVAQKDSRIVKEHPDWLYRHKGEPWYCGCNWGGFYSLDIDNPQVIRYLEQTFDKVLNQWGFDLVKLDFLYGAAPFGDENETRAGRMYRGMELLRRLCGDKLILGCGVPVMPAFGIADYCRISCDVGLDWDDNFIMRHAHRERVSTRQAILNTIFRRQLNGRAYLSDPDVFFLRDENIKLTHDEKNILATVNALFGGVLLCSDNMGQYSDDTKKDYSRLLDLRRAENIKVRAEERIEISYVLDGREYSLKI